MAGGIVQAEEINLMNGWLGIAAYTAATTPMKLALSTATTSSTSAGTEVSGGSYGRLTIAFSTPTTATPSVSSNTSLISFTNMPATTTTDINIYDSTGTPVRRAWGALTASKTTALGDTLSFAAASITASLT